MAKFCFTFGCDEQFPYDFHEFVEIEAEDENEAREVFRAIWPPREGSSFLNCSMVYSESSWRTVGDKYYRGVEPAAVVSIKRRIHERR